MSNGLSKAELIKMAARVIPVSNQPNNTSLNIKKYCVRKIFGSSHTGHLLIGVLWILLFISDSREFLQGEERIQSVNRKISLNCVRVPGQNGTWFLSKVHT